MVRPLTDEPDRLPARPPVDRATVAIWIALIVPTVWSYVELAKYLWGWP